MRVDEMLCPINDPDNLSICETMCETYDAGLLGADLQALIHWDDPTPLGRRGGIAHGIATHTYVYAMYSIVVSHSTSGGLSTLELTNGAFSR
jgi:hypothetical protein